MHCLPGPGWKGHPWLVAFVLTAACGTLAPPTDSPVTGSNSPDDTSREPSMETGVSLRLQNRIRSDFADPDTAEEVIRMVGEAGSSERVQAAIVFQAAGDPEELRIALDLAELDWRDVLVNGGLADGDWEERLDQILGP